MRQFLLMSVVLGSLGARAEPAILTMNASSSSPFERRFGVGAYATGWAGAYSAAGVGGRLRVEVLPFLGLDLFGEALLVTSPSGIRHDHPIGFNLYVPFTFGRFRVRPLLGMCVTFSFIEPTEPTAPHADDVLFGAHLGAGAEYALFKHLSLFAEAKGVLWLGHDRSVAGWTGAVGNEVSPFPVAQVQVGLTFHL